MTKEQIALEALQGNPSVAKEDGLAFFPPASLPQELRGHSLLGQVPAASLTLLKLPATWSAKLSGPSDCPWSVNSARTYARRVGVGPTQYFKVLPWVCFRYACLKSTLCMLLHLSALIALLRGLSLSPPRCPCPVFCLYLSVEACLSPSLPFAVFALRLVGCDNVCCSSLVLSITAGSRRFPAVNSQSIYVPFGLVNSKKKTRNQLLDSAARW